MKLLIAHMDKLFQKIEFSMYSIDQLVMKIYRHILCVRHKDSFLYCICVSVCQGFCARWMEIKVHVQPKKKHSLQPAKKCGIDGH